MTNFNELGLDDRLLSALNELGYEKPSPVQAASIPHLLAGNDIVAQAQTGTGKTAAFTLPILSQLDLTKKNPQALILAPTRELAIQVAEACHSYAKHLKGFHVLPIYGGQEYGAQLRGLKRGAHVIVGTPGRVMDHLRRGSLNTKALTTLVLDEADEMLKMGFLEDVEWILEQIEQDHQTALFSATMPSSIRKIAQNHLNNPEQVKIKANEQTVKNIQQYYTKVFREHKLEALTRFLEVEDYTAAIIFTRTKVMSSELSDKLSARGLSVAAINGDMPQKAREKVIQRLKKGTLDIVVATEVAARGLDAERISLVVNYDIPTDLESYVHRIGRTGRAGREGKALVLVTPREMRMLRDIEHFTKVKMTHLTPPAIDDIEEKRLDTLMAQITDATTHRHIDKMRDKITQITKIHDQSALDIAAALAAIIHDQQTHDFNDIDLTPPPRDDNPSRKKKRKGRGEFRKDTPRKARDRGNKKAFAVPPRKRRSPKGKTEGTRQRAR